MVLIHIFGISLSRIPGSLGDSRMIWYVLEHFYVWISEREISFWDAPFFYPYPMTTAFSDSLLGSAPLYALFRSVGINKYFSYQIWLILGFVLNYFIAAFILVKCSIKPLAAGAGAFFFAFGMPIFAQEYHLQLLYRFLVPVAGYLLWRFSLKPRLVLLPLLFFAVVWQFYIAIYTGLFLVFMIFVMICLIPLFSEEKAGRNIFRFWKNALTLSFRNATMRARVLNSVGVAISLLLLVLLFIPYYQVTRIYGFSKPVEYVITMIPRIESFFLADESQIWNTEKWVSLSTNHRQEHQLFPGLAVYLLIIIGLLWNFRHTNKRFALINLSTVGVLILLTTYNNGFSVYQYLLKIPGLSSIRAVSRIHLVSMWPVAVFIATVLDGLLRKKVQHVNFRVIPLMIIGFMLLESLYFDHHTYTKAQAEHRLSILYEQIETNELKIKDDSILYVGEVQGDEAYLTDVDGMWLGLELRIPTLNGMTSNFPDGDVVASSDCSRIDVFIKNYMRFAGIEDEAFRDKLFNRLVILNMDHCDYKQPIK